MDESSLFAKRLKEERKRLGLSQAQAGEAVGVSREMWGKYERGAMPGGDVFIALKKAGFDVPTILAGSNRLDVSISPHEMALIDRYRRSHKDVQRGVDALLAATVNEEEEK
ncbi:hypothetical protein SKTS_33000 [Sulfurimicrobium lacus]|uniref:HTH cro/C1-type domain-containing protein n=1 Tax=Sulfurimicrobium lacus TaxID=2715678 RepID=A0A6F8VFG0_9PROT|nr:helix-turn-helix transcriptional regulator [Sulfurimicrobium lacus]BCB28414.1 hypothetical protein SKTS_33000 [Sulfurimicrobium lacus]